MNDSVADRKKRESINKFLNPRSIAIVGATENPGYGLSFMNNFLTVPYKGELYPVNPKYETVHGYTCYPSVLAIGKPVDLAVVIVNARFVEQTVRECADCGVGACLIISAGFSELDKVHGKENELRLRQIANESGMHLVGPNTIGSANVKLNLWMHGTGGGTLDVKDFTFGHAAIVSQSGAAGFGPLINTARDRGVGIKYLVTTGNEADLEICDFIDFMLDDDEVQSIAVLIEGIKDCEYFLNLARKAFKAGKKLILMKLGESAVGERAAQGHTASLTGDMIVFNAMVKQYGMIKAEDYDELIEYARITQKQFQLAGKNLCVISHSGGISGFLGDQLSKNGFEIPVFSETTQHGIDEHLKGFGSPRNPLDLTSPMSRPCFSDMMKVVADNENVDGYVFATHYYTPDKVHLLVDAITQLKDKPYFLAWTGSLYFSALDAVRAKQIPLSFSIQKLARMLWKSYETTLVKSVPEQSTPNPSFVIASGKSGFMDEVSAKSLAASFGLTVPERMIIENSADPEDIRIAFDGPYALKIVSDTIIHKTDVGGVLLNVQSPDDIPAACRSIREKTRDIQDQIKGIVVEKMCPAGLDIIVGVRKDAQFGPVLLVGLGGIYTELFKMTSCRLLPVTRDNVEQMLDEIPGLPNLLAGYRGQPSHDRESLVTAIMRISDIVEANRESIELFEINPLRVLPGKGGVHMLDCVIKINKQPDCR